MARFRRLRHRFRHAVGREDDRSLSVRDFVQFLDEDGALGLQRFYHVAVVDDLMAHIDGRAVFGERELDDLDGAVDAGAKAARRRDIDGQRKEACLRPDLVAHASHLRPGNVAKRLKRRPSRALSRRSTGDSLTANFGETGCQDLIQAFAGLAPRHIRRGGPACQAEDGDKLRRSCALWLLPCCRAGSLLLAPLLLAACAVSSISNPSKSSEVVPVSQDGMLANAKADAPQLAPLNGDSLHCPQVVAWPTDRLLTIYAGGKIGDSQAIVHRGEITKLARECQLYGDRVVVKYGFAGRVLLGPKGAPGQVTLPVSIKVADADRKVLANDKTNVSTIIPSENPVGYFSMVKEITFPISMGMRPEDYKVFVAF